MAWNLRYSAPVVGGQDAPEDDFPSATSQGPLVMPGAYSARLFQKLNGTVTELAGPGAFKVVADGASAMNPQERVAQEEFLRKVARLSRAVAGALNSANEVGARLKQIRQALHEAPAVEQQLGAAAEAIQRQNNEMLRALRGDVALAVRNENVPPSINGRVTGILEGERFAITRPTQTHVNDYAIASEEFGQQLARLRNLIQVDLAKLEKDMEAAGAPWTPGRMPEWSEK